MTGATRFLEPSETVALLARCIGTFRGTPVHVEGLGTFLFRPDPPRVVFRTEHWLMEYIDRGESRTPRGVEPTTFGEGISPALSFLRWLGQADVRPDVASDAAVSALVDSILRPVMAGQSTAVPGLGSFHVETKESEQIMNPQTGALVTMAPKRMFWFEAAPELLSRAAAAAVR